jgi:Na+/proline symporter
MLRIKDPGGFLLGKRKLGHWMMIASTFAGGINANHPVSVASNTYRQGLSGMWLSLTYIIMTPFFWIYPPVVRRMRIVTPIDFFRLRYGRTMELVVNITTLIGASVGFGAGTKAAYEFTKVASGGQITDFQAQCMIIIPTLIYTLMGGIIAVCATDMLQSLLIVVLSFLLIPFCISFIGGPAQVEAKVPAEMWDLVSGSGTPGIWLFWFAVSLLASASMVYGGGAGSAKNELAARWAILGNLGKRFCTVGWGLVGVFAVAMFGTAATSGVRPDEVFAKACVVTLPTGMRGVMVAAMLAAVMSTLAGMMLGMGGQIVNNIYKDYFVKNAGANHYLLMARVFTALSVVLGWVIAAKSESLVHVVIISEQVTGVVGVAKLASIMWRRATAAGALAGVAAMAPLFYFGNIAIGKMPEWFRWLAQMTENAHWQLGINPHFSLAAAKMTEVLPVQISTPIYLVAGVLVMIVVSLLTKQHNDYTVAEFYARLDTPVGEEHKLKEAGYEVDTVEELDHAEIQVDKKDHDISRRLLVMDILSLPYLLWTKRVKLSDYWVDLWGIVGAVGFIVGFIWLTKWIVALIR